MALFSATETMAAFELSRQVSTMAGAAGYSLALELANMNHGQTRMSLPASANGRIRLHICRSLCVQSFGYRIQVKRQKDRSGSASAICLAALDAKCSAVQTLPQVERSKTMTKAPVRETVKTPPKLDDSGPALPPHDGGGGGGGGGGGDSSGGWILFGILLLLSFLKEKERKEEEEQENISYRTLPELDF